MPTPPPMSCQRFLSRLLPCVRRGYHTVGTVSVRPSDSSTWSTASVTLTFTARAPCGSVTEILIPAPDEPVPISLAAQIDQHISIRIDTRALERVDDDGRVRDLDDRGAWHDVTGNEALAPEDRREIEVAQLRPVDRSRAGARVARRNAIGLGRGDDARLGAHCGGAHAIGHDLHARLAEPRALAVDRLVPSMEVADELGERILVECPARHRHLDLVDLAFVTNISGAREARIRNRHTIQAKLLSPALLQLGKALHHSRGTERARLNVHRLIYMEEVGRGRAER